MVCHNTDIYLYGCQKLYSKIAWYFPMVKVFISFKEKGDFGGKKNANLVEIWRDSYNHMDECVECFSNFIMSVEDVKRLRSGLFVFVYVKNEKGERFTYDNLNRIFKVIYGKCGCAWKLENSNTVWGLLPRWGKEIIKDKKGERYDMIRAIRGYAKGRDEDEIWEEVNTYRRERGKPPYPYVKD